MAMRRGERQKLGGRFTRNRFLLRQCGDRRDVLLGHFLRFGEEIHPELIGLLRVRDDLLADIRHTGALDGEIRHEALGVIDLRRRFPLSDAQLCILL